MNLLINVIKKTALPVLLALALGWQNKAQAGDADRARSQAAGLEISARRIAARTPVLADKQKRAEELQKAITKRDEQGQPRGELETGYNSLRDEVAAGRAQQEEVIRVLQSTTIKAAESLLAHSPNGLGLAGMRLRYAIQEARASIAGYHAWAGNTRRLEPLTLPGQLPGRAPVMPGPAVTIAEDGLQLTPVQNMAYSVSLRLNNAADRGISVRVWIQLPTGDSVKSGDGIIMGPDRANTWTVDVVVPSGGRDYTWRAYAATPDGTVRVKVLEGNFKQ